MFKQILKKQLADLLNCKIKFPENGCMKNCHIHKLSPLLYSLAMHDSPITEQQKSNPQVSQAKWLLG